jgi:stage II sporulation protein GA (sporulation sigma-E factor processing peptidase)
MEAGVNLDLEVYIDVIFLINFIMDIILLLIVKIILKSSCKVLRIFSGAAAGAFGACILTVMPDLNGLLQFLLSYVIICLAMICIAFPRTDWRTRGKALAVLYISTFFLGGAMNSLYYYSRVGYYFRELLQGKLFQNLDTFHFVVIVFITLSLTPILIKTILLFRRGKAELYQLQLWYKDKSVDLVGLLDTGNHLRDPIYGKPVLVSEYSALKPLLSVHQADKLGKLIDITEGNPVSTENEETAVSEIQFDDDIGEQINIMMIPYHSIGKKNGMMPAFTMNRIIIWDGKEEICNEKVIVAVSRNKLSRQNEYQVILHTDIM